MLLALLDGSIATEKKKDLARPAYIYLSNPVCSDTVSSRSCTSLSSISGKLRFSQYPQLQFLKELILRGAADGRF
jgi:hypothetical protein